MFLSGYISGFEPGSSRLGQCAERGAPEDGGGGQEYPVPTAGEGGAGPGEERAGGRQELPGTQQQLQCFSVPLSLHGTQLSPLSHEVIQPLSSLLFLTSYFRIILALAFLLHLGNINSLNNFLPWL